ncbi:Heat stress transcription factor A-5 [Dichanthelium oligosanthes]|uniref:Heat stress transcription factor A-5 n=1 Tax=Dichanthelium oligosanthes TaxID=888268 RepID=A0A1E5VZU5_9POAL|nr:Heat stress transcription factor A-5 [Dichanthelium oligosanthes]
MEVAGARGSGGGGGGGGGAGGPAPFLLKTYEMVDDPLSDAVVSWSDASNGSFVVWNPPEFAARMLPAYFKHSNFSSFIRQLNTYVRNNHPTSPFPPFSALEYRCAARVGDLVRYCGRGAGNLGVEVAQGFRKIDPERWEFANEYFVKGQKHLLKNIHRRKPIHSHSHQPGALPDNERALFEDEIDRLSREKTALQADLWKFNQQQSGAVSQIEDLERRVLDMEQRQVKLLSFLQQASKNPQFVSKLIKMAEASPIFADAFHKKRRLPGLECSTEAAETTSSFYDDHSSTSRQEMGNILNQHFSDKLKLGLCPAMTESNLITLSTQSSYEDNGSPHGKHPDCERTGVECLPLVPQMMELSDTGTSICPSKSVSFTAAVNDDGILPCHLNLTLASCLMDVNRSQVSNANGDAMEEEKDDQPEATAATMDEGNGIGRCYDDTQNKALGDPATAADTTTPPHGDSQAPPEEPAAPPVVANDKFWEQFLTERPGCSEAEEASSTLRRDSDHRQAYEDTRSDRRDMGQLKL